MNRNIMKICLGDNVKPIYTSLLTELRQPAPHKGVVDIMLNGDCIVIEINSDTISGLRALTNSFLYLIHAAYSTLTEVDSIN